MYLSSALYHVLLENRAKRALRVLDHVAILCLIAGTYTPFTLGVLRGAWGWTLFGIVWSLAFLGVTLKIKGSSVAPSLPTGLYLAMGWLMVVAIRPLWFRSAIAGYFLAFCGRHRIHGWSGILCGWADTLQPFRVASLYRYWHRLSLFCGAAIWGLISLMPNSLKRSLRLLRFHQILRPKESSHRFLRRSPLHLIHRY